MNDVFRMRFLQQRFAHFRMDHHPADAFVVERQALHFLQRVHVAAIEDDGGFQGFVDPLEVGVPELLPLREEQERVCALDRLILVGAEHDLTIRDR